MDKLSIIIPVLNETGNIQACLKNLQPLRNHGHEVIVVDGGSNDNTVSQAHLLADQVLLSPAGRARQMNLGAAHASGTILLFLHADTFLPADADQMIIDGLKQTKWGRFNVSFNDKRIIFKIIAFLMNWRSRITGIATGDQAIFVQRNLFNIAGCFPNIALMEDIRISKTLKNHGKPLCIKQAVITSSRRWKQRGILRTILLMWQLRLMHFFGASSADLAKRYQ